MESWTTYYSSPDHKKRGKVESKYIYNSKIKDEESSSNKSKHQDDSDKINLIMENIRNKRKSIEEYKTRIKDLNSEILTLQNSMLHMFSSAKVENIKRPFPSFEELCKNILNYCEDTCPKFFLEYLKPEFEFTGIVYFFKNVLSYSQKQIEKHFSGLNSIMKNTLQNPPNLEPLECVLNKSYQANWENILNKLLEENFCEYVATKIQGTLDISGGKNGKKEVIRNIMKFINETITLLFQCYLSNPSVIVEIGRIGKTPKFNFNTLESFDGDIRNNEDTHVILPAFYFLKNNREVKYISRPRVLSDNYNFE